MNPTLLVVVQRYGDVAGGAEGHARMLVGKLREHLDVTVATTTARDYWTWSEEFQAGETRVDGVRVLRFPVAEGRAADFRRHEHAAYARVHSLEDERAFVRAQGPHAPELLEYLFAHGREYDHVLFFTYIYEPTAYGLPVVPERAVLVPTAHDEPALRLSVYRPLFHAPRAIAFNTEEERALVHRVFGNARIPNDVLGVGVDVPPEPSAQRFRARHGIEGPFFLYLGRIVESKGTGELFELFVRWRESDPSRKAMLVLGGHPEMAIPDRPWIRHLGYVSDADKFDAYAACTALVVPSKLESLSLITLEAWAMGRPVVCHAASDVLRGMSRRAGAGLAYDSFATFAEILDLLVERQEVAARLGDSGRAFVASTYSWPRVVETYLDLFAEVRTRNA